MSGTSYRLPFRGEPITVLDWHSGRIVRARAAGFAVHNDTKRLRWRETKSKKHYGTLSLDDEGATWVRGWKGERVTAMRTVAALRRANREQELEEQKLEDWSSK